MNSLEEFCKKQKENFTPRIKDTRKPVSFWSEKDVLDDKIVDAFVLILRTTGCSWAKKSGCTMCGYFNDSAWTKVTDEDLLKQYEIAMSKYKDEKIVKIFTSGSFLDDKEISEKTQEKILSDLFSKTDKVSVESRPEYITDKKLSWIKKLSNSKMFEAGIGLETSNDEIRLNYLNKGFSFKHYIKAAEILKKYDFSIKTYVLIKAPFLTEQQAIEDGIQTVKDISKYTNIISFNPVSIQKNTFVSFLWNRKKYRPPWLFSIIEILSKSSDLTKDILLKCDITGGGSIRGAHNCRECDRKYLKAIQEFSLKQDKKIFNNLKCDCYEKYLDQLELELYGFESLVNMYG